MTGNDGSTRCCPIIWRNTISICGLYGIIAEGAQSEPDIRGNIISQNRKAGIKVTDFAQAQIGGTAKIDIKFIPSTGAAKEQQARANNTFATAKMKAVSHFYE